MFGLSYLLVWVNYGYCCLLFVVGLLVGFFVGLDNVYYRDFLKCGWGWWGYELDELGC